MAFLGNDAVNRVNLHYGIQSLAIAGGGIFFLVFMLRAGVSMPVVLLAQAAIMAGRFAIRPLLLPLAKRWGLKRILILGTFGQALQYPILAEVDGVGPMLLVLCVTTAVADILYWPTYNAYFSVIGDAEHRGHQVSAREALVAVVNIVGPLLGAWALVTFGPRSMFAAVGVVQALATLPLLGAPDVAVKASVPGGFRAGRLGAVLAATDGWFDAWYILVWQIALFVSLGESVSAYGGAMALAALVGAGFGLFLGQHIDSGGGRRAVAIAYSVTAAILIVRAASLESPWMAVAANALGALAMPLLLPPLGTAVYNLAKASPCPIRFQIATEGGWDVGCFCACLLAAALAASDVPMSLGLLFALPTLATAAFVLRRYYASHPQATLAGCGLPSTEPRTEFAERT